MQKKLIWAVASGLIGAVAVLAAAYKFQDKINFLQPAPGAAHAPAEPLTLEQRYPHVFPERSTLSSVLSELEVSAEAIHQIVQTAKPYRDLGRITPGTRFRLLYAPATSAAEETAALTADAAAEAANLSGEIKREITGIKIRFSPQESLQIENSGGQWSAHQTMKPVETKVTTFSGVVTSSLWESALEAKMDPYLIAELAEIFAWQMDFAREVRENDRWRLSVEQEFIQGEPVGWGSILAAEYINDGETHAAYLFRKNGEDLGYFGPDGSSLRRMFLKAPIQYSRISSRFQNRRFHPILKTARAHLGVDYAAPKGTPIRAVGDGVIQLAGWNGGAGNMIKLRHNGTYTTAYKHLNGFAKGIRRGAKVQQGQIIGYVGTTGLSTGPHLHFEFFVNGRYVDPLRQKFPSADPVPQAQLAQFITSRESLADTLPHWGDEPAEKPGQLRADSRP